MIEDFFDRLFGDDEPAEMRGPPPPSSYPPNGYQRQSDADVDPRDAEEEDALPEQSASTTPLDEAEEEAVVEPQL